MHRRHNHRQGNIVVLSAFLMVVLIGLLAFALAIVGAIVLGSLEAAAYVHAHAHR